MPIPSDPRDGTLPVRMVIADDPPGLRWPPDHAGWRAGRRDHRGGRQGPGARAALPIHAARPRVAQPADGGRYPASDRSHPASLSEDPRRRSISPRPSKDEDSTVYTRIADNSPRPPAGHRPSAFASGRPHLPWICCRADGRWRRPPAFHAEIPRLDAERPRWPSWIFGGTRRSVGSLIS
jgi:hypothetical protein